MISLFQKQFVKTGLFDVDRARALSRSFEKRQKSDDGDVSTVAPEEARGIGEEVQSCVDECARVLERLIAQE